MKHAANFEIFLVCPPGLELVLRDEARAAGFKKAKAAQGGVRFRGSWRDVWRANLTLRGATRVLARIASFQANHLKILEKQTRQIRWGDVLRPEIPVRVEATCRKSKIYHQGAAAERVENAITQTIGAPIDREAELTVKLRIDEDQCTLSLDTSGESLHKRGHKQAVGKAPMRETLAALFLRQCGYTGGEPVLDPMCGSGTFVIEAAEMAAGLAPGRSRHFAFEELANFDGDFWATLRDAVQPQTPQWRFHGSDRNAGAIENAEKNSRLAGVSAFTTFTHAAISDLARPDGPPGLVIANPPYGGRIGDKKQLYALYGTFGRVLKERFGGWRVGIITNEGGLARATALPFEEPGPGIDHGGIRVRLYRTAPLP